MKKSFALYRNSLNQDRLVNELRAHFKTICDHRAANIIYSLEDILMSAYAMFALKYPSLLCFEQQTKMEQHNLKHIFGLQATCSDAQMRRVLDEIHPEDLQELFPLQFQHLLQAGLIQQFTFLNKYLLLTIDGVEYFRSKKINCQKCQTQQHQDGQISYSHSMLAAVLVHPYQKEVFPIAQEAIQKQDGQSKNDSELNANKRLLQKLKQQYDNQPFMLVQDAMFANQSNIQQILEYGWQYLLSVKPGNKPRLFTYFETRKKNNKINTLIIPDGKIQHHFYFMNNIALTNSSDCKTNFLYYEEHGPNGKVKKFSWISSLRLSKNNVFQIMRAARARWKIENETFNTLKNQGYHF